MAVSRRLTAIGSALLIGVLATPLAATPAAAATGSVTWQPDTLLKVAPSGPGKVHTITVHESGDVAHAKLTFDFTTLGTVAVASFPAAASNCTITGTSGVCDLPDHNGADGTTDVTFPLRLVPGAGAVPGATATLSGEVTLDGATAKTQTYPISVVDGTDLVVTAGEQPVAKPGEKDYTLNVDVANTGSVTSHGLLVQFDFPPRFEPKIFDNCEYASGGELNAALCDVTGDVDPGDGVTLQYPGTVGIHAAPHNEFVAFVAPGGAVGDAAKNLVKRSQVKPLTRTGQKLVATAGGSADEIDADDNVVASEFLVDTHYDLEVPDAAVTGVVGDTVHVVLKVHNNGPADDEAGFLSAPPNTYSFLFTVPAWADVTGVPTGCSARDTADGPSVSEEEGTDGHPFYHCSNDDGAHLPAAATDEFKFTLKVKASSGANGTVVLDADNKAVAADIDKSNNDGTVTLAAPDQPSLPITGANAGLIGGIGAGLLLLGALLVIAGRRRKRTAAI
jgi:LPXTG-motif cell wall-anchored protein